MSAVPDDPVGIFRAFEREATPTAAAVILGVELRKLRGELPAKVAAKAIGASVSKISRLERAESPPDIRDVRDLADRYGADAGTREALEQLAIRAREPEWFQPHFNDCTAHWLRRLFGLEALATDLMTYESGVVSGLLQTSEYAREIIRTGLHAREHDEVERRVQLRKERQLRVFDQATPPRTVVLMDQAVLRRRAGSDQVMAGQMLKLLEMSDRPGVSIRFVKEDSALAANAASAGSGSMTHLKFGVGGPPTIVYLEGYEEASYRTKEDDLERHVQLLLRLSGEAAASTAESREMVVEALGRFTP
ncbi:helix-turn-helix domain-containing protein [Streptomyces sp. NPDC057509]|uniref:helix-turn-helix domain-containing protein n=1 Tax=Streptomyces sp. NPDC057509 TaxID=3346152 RepID=UPI0036BE1132